MGTTSNSSQGKALLPSKNGRNVMEGILWKLRTGGPRRDVPEEFCPWQTAFNRFNRWAAKGLWEDFFLFYAAKLTNGVFGMLFYLD